MKFKNNLDIYAECRLMFLRDFSGYAQTQFVWAYEILQ